jgi:hypothetical protein
MITAVTAIHRDGNFSNCKAEEDFNSSNNEFPTEGMFRETVLMLMISDAV